MTKIGDVLLDNVVASTVITKYLGLNSNFFSSNKDSKILNKNFEVLRIEGVVHIKFASELKKYLAEYHAVLLDEKENVSEYDYVVELNKNKKIGFWR